MKHNIHIGDIYTDEYGRIQLVLKVSEDCKNNFACALWSDLGTDAPTCVGSVLTYKVNFRSQKWYCGHFWMQHKYII